MVERQKFAFAAETHVGLVRQLNEDAMTCLPELGVWLVADGMGGHSGGDYASRIITESVAAIDPALPSGDIMRAVRQALLDAHETIQEESARQDGATIGSTAVGLILSAGHFACLWAGDSRLYLARGGEVQQLSTDHSLVNDLVAAGQITEEEAESHPHANVITRAVGVGDEIEIDKIRGTYEHGDRFLLCSDGLSGYVRSDHLKQMLLHEPMDSIATTMIHAALDGGGKDNVTAIVVEVPEDDGDWNLGASDQG